MNARVRSRLTTARAVARAARAQQITFLAASVAYYAFVSLLPALLLLLVVATTVGGEAFADRVLSMTGEFLTPAGQETIAEAFENAAGRGGATVLGVAVLLWSALKVFRALDTAFQTVYGTTETASFGGQLRDAVTALASIGLGVIAMVGVGGLVATAGFGFVLEFAGVLLLPALLTVVFLPVYYVFPDVQMTLRGALPGTVFVAIGWTVLQAGFQVYAAGAGQYRVYGVVGGVLLLVTWLYIAALLVILGAVVNEVLAAGDDEAAERRVEEIASGGGIRGRVGALRGRASLRRGDRQSQGEGLRGKTQMAEERERVEPTGAPDIAELDERVAALRADLDEFESDVQSSTVEKPELEAELKRYVRSRMRRGHARGWGPYLVLLYGVVLTMGAFYWLDGGWAVLAMLVLFLSTLGLYVVFVAVGVVFNLLGVPGRGLDAVRQFRR